MPEKRRNQVHAYLSDEEVGMLSHLAASCGLTASDALRQALRSAPPACDPEACKGQCGWDPPNQYCPNGGHTLFHCVGDACVAYQDSGFWGACCSTGQTCSAGACQ